MRNLKRALSLALATIMVMSMMVIGAGATSYDDLADKDKIVNKEAVSTLVELNVINGKDDGNFDPSGIITRAEMAKLICVVLNGGKDPQLGNVVTYTYADTVGHWAAGYIEYCTKLGIIAGDGKGNFNPNATVTGSEAAKMLLAAVGYQPSIEGYVGSNWEVSTNVRANNIGLYDGLDINPSEGLTRDSAAQMVYNALDARVVTYKYTLTTDGSTVSSIPELVERNSAGEVATMLEDKFKAVKVEAFVTSNEIANLDNNYRGSEDEGETYLVRVPDTVKGTTGTYKVSTDKDLLGQSVYVYIKYKDDRSIVTDAVVIGQPIATEKNKIVESHDGTGLADLLDDNKLTVNSSTTYLCNFGGTYDAKGNVSDMTEDEFDALCGTTGVGIRLIDNDGDKKVDYAIAEKYSFGAVSKYLSDKNTDAFRIGGSVYDEDYDADQVVGFDEVSKDDFVLYVEYGGKIYVQKPESVEAKLDAFSTSKKTVKLDGETIDWSGIKGVYPSDILSLDTHLSSGTALDASAVWYKDIYGYVIAVGDADESALNYAVLLGYENQTKAVSGGLGSPAQAKVLLSDGTVDTFKVATIGGDKVTNCTDGSGNPDKTQAQTGEVGFNSGDQYKIYSYTIMDNGQIKLTAKYDVKDTTNNENTKYVKGRSTIDVGSDNFTVTSNTVFLYMKENGSVARFVGKTAPSINDSMNTPAGSTSDALDASGITVAVQANTRGEALVVFLNDVNPSNDFTDNFVYIYNRKLTETSDGFEASAIIDGEITTIVITEAKNGDGTSASYIHEGWFDDDSNPATPEVYGHYLTYPDVDTDDTTLMNGVHGLFTYAKNDDNTYVLRHMDSDNPGYGYMVKGNASAVSYSSNYIRMNGSRSYTITNDTLGFYARTGKKALDSTTVSRNDDVVLVVNDDKEIIYSFVTYYAYDKDATPSKPEGPVTEGNFTAPAGVTMTFDDTTPGLVDVTVRGSGVDAKVADSASDIAAISSAFGATVIGADGYYATATPMGVMTIDILEQFKTSATGSLGASNFKIVQTNGALSKAYPSDAEFGTAGSTPDVKTRTYTRSTLSDGLTILVMNGEDIQLEIIPVVGGHEVIENAVTITISNNLTFATKAP